MHGKRIGSEESAPLTSGPSSPTAAGVHLNRLGRDVCGLARCYTAYLDALVAPYGISSAHVPLLAYLWEGHTGDTQNDIARSLGVDKGTVSRNVQALVRLGLIVQECSSRDSRACTVELTQRGWDLAEPIAAIDAAWTESIAKALADQDVSTFGQSVHSLAEHAEALLDAANPKRTARKSEAGQQASASA